jgi:DNA-binding winged helix-turn-helix (wHTH) protein
MPHETNHIYEFENFRLDLTEKLLSGNGNQVSLTPKVFETLRVLIENAGHLVSKDELMQKVWPDRFVEETNLTFNIKMLRKALGDNAAKPRFIETVPRRGYRFVAEVINVNGNGVVLISDTVTLGSGSRDRLNSKIRRIGLIFAGILLVALAAAIGIRWRVAVGQPNVPLLSGNLNLQKLSTSGDVTDAVVPFGPFDLSAQTKEKSPIPRGFFLRRLGLRPFQVSAFIGS